jgi:hypothetical protein
VLYKKPVIFFTTNEMEKSSFDYNCIRAYSHSLNKTFININNRYEIDWKRELRVDHDSYRDYKERYIKKKGTKEEPFWKIVLEEIRK